MSLAFAQVFIRGCRLSDLSHAMDQVFLRYGYVPFDEGFIPNAYPEEKGEFFRVAMCGPDACGTITVLFSDWERAFAIALELSKKCKGSKVVTLMKPPADPVRLKVYCDGGVLLKAGDDLDEELFYNPLQADSTKANEFLVSWGGDKVDCGEKVVSATKIIGALGVVRADVSFTAAVNGAWPLPLESRIYVNIRSRLYLES